MKQGIKICILPLFASLIFIASALIKTVEIVSPSQWNKFEMMSNAFMLVVVVAGISLGALPDKAVSEEKAVNVLNNVVVSGIAFCMNVTVFEHEIRRNQLLDSLWGWSMGWIVLAVIQVLLLSGLGKKLLAQICAFLIWCKSIIGLVREIGSDLLNTIRQNKNISLVIIAGFILWGVYIGIWIYVSSASAVFTGTDIFEKSVWLWVTYSVICILACGVRESLKKIKEIIESLNGKKILIALAVMVLLVIAGVIPFVRKVLVIIFLIPLAAMGLLWFVVRTMDKKRKNTENDNHQGEDPASINLKDLVVVAISMPGIPLAVICFEAWLQIYGGQSIVAEGAETGFMWLDFVNAAGDVAKRLLELFI